MCFVYAVYCSDQGQPFLNLSDCSIYVKPIFHCFMLQPVYLLLFSSKWRSVIYCCCKKYIGICMYMFVTQLMNWWSYILCTTSYNYMPDVGWLSVCDTVLWHLLACCVCVSLVLDRCWMLMFICCQLVMPMLSEWSHCVSDLFRVWCLLYFKFTSDVASKRFFNG